jgi:N-acetylmuramoyl-L-alanine amidase
MKLVALALFASLVAAQAARDVAVTGVRTWPTAEGTRVAIEVSGEFEFKYDRLQNPDRVYFDIKGAKPRIDGRRIWSRQVTDKLVQKIRVAETQPNVTRVVVELTGPVEVTPSQLVSPNRLMIELRAAAAPATPTAPITEVTAAPPAITPPAPVTDLARVESKPEPKAEIRSEVKSEPKRDTAKSTTPPRKSESKSTPKVDVAAVTPAPPPIPVDAPAEAPAIVKEAPLKDASAAAAELARGARRTSSGGSSLTRALGLKLNRIVLDAGHGGHDQGTSGAKGLLEKELVLDVTLRLGKLIQEGLGAEVIYTRSDDTFIPLEGRTAIANDKKADLFLSVHANSSPVAKITGVETYYLNFTDSKEAMDLAARENAASQRSIFELQDLLHKITLHEKIDESREFANRVQSSLFSLSTRNFPGSKNRGVKKAPFVVLIGAQMPSILAEIGFVTNSKEEQLLKRGDYRQKIAESLYKGVSKYAESLSHFQLAQNQ